jgi:hypothetical protein
MYSYVRFIVHPKDLGAGTKAINPSILLPHRIALTIAILREDGVPGGSYSDPQEGLSVLSFLLLSANSEISVRAATADTPTVTTMNSKMISIFLVLSQILIYLESQSQRILDGDPPSLVLSAFQSCKP